MSRGVHDRYPWIGRDPCGTCGGVRWRVVETPHGRVARCERCLPRLRDGERVVDRVTTAPLAPDGPPP